MAEDARLTAEFTMGGTIMGSSENDPHTQGMIGGGFGVAGRGDIDLCQLVISSRGRPCARATLAANGALLRWEQL